MKNCNYMPANIQLNDILDDKKFIIPQFQRSVVWKSKRKKDFIGNILNGEPFGVILIRMNNGRYELIDGLQRITTIRDYKAHPFEYLSEKDIDINLVEEIWRTYLSDVGVAIDEDYVINRAKELQIFIYNCIKDNLQSYEIIEQTKEKFNFTSRKISSLINQVYEKFQKDTDIGNLSVMAIDYKGPSENIPTVFYNLNTGGVQLTKYETYAALWSKPLFKIYDEKLILNVKNKYLQLQEDSELDVAFNEEDLIDNGMTLFEYCYALGGVIRDKEKHFDEIFGDNTKSTDPIGFEMLSLILGLNVNKAEQIYQILEKAPVSFLVSIKNTIVEALTEIRKALHDVIVGLNGARLNSDSTYLAYHIFMAYVKEYYNIDVKTWSITKKESSLSIKQFRKYLPVHYVYDCITDYWRINRQVSDLTRDINDYAKRTKYWTNIRVEAWESALLSFIDSQKSVSKTIPQKNKIFIDYMMKLKLKINPNFTKYFNMIGEDDKVIDIEHIVPKKEIQAHIKDMRVSQQNLFPVSCLGNICYLASKDNRAKKEKTIYEYNENRPSFSLNTDYLNFILYPKNEELRFVHYSNLDFREEYFRFIKDRTEMIRKEFLALIKQVV